METKTNIELIYNKDFGSRFLDWINYESKEETKNALYFHFSDIVKAREEMNKAIQAMTNELHLESHFFNHSENKFTIDNDVVLELTYETRNKI